MAALIGVIDGLPFLERPIANAKRTIAKKRQIADFNEPRIVRFLRPIKHNFSMPSHRNAPRSSSQFDANWLGRGLEGNVAIKVRGAKRRVASLRVLAGNLAPLAPPQLLLAINPLRSFA